MQTFSNEIQLYHKSVKNLKHHPEKPLPIHCIEQIFHMA